ncbi:MAG: acetyl-CoA synthetase, partial [Halioglobus sp.]
MTTQITTLAQYKEEYKKSVDNPEAFWKEQAETFTWATPFDKTLEWNFDIPDVKWFLNGKMNITVNCLDRHIEKRGDQTAILWEPNDPKAEVQEYTYIELLAAVNRCANGLKSKGIEKGDRVIFYMPMVPELAIGLLACARIGAI